MKRICIAGWMTLVLLATCAALVQAELPPGAYPDPSKAAEDLDIEILAVARMQTYDSQVLTRWNIELIAEVRAVRRTKAGLRAGSKIVIRYSAHRNKEFGVPGPGSHLVPAKGEVWSVVLNDSGNTTASHFIPGGAPYSTFRVPDKK